MTPPDQLGNSLKIHLLCALTILGPAIATFAETTASARSTGSAQIVRHAQAKIVKIYGAGGLRGLESYQSGMWISANGHVLTSWSYVLDADPIIVVDDQGERHEATLLGIDPILEIAVLKTDASGPDYFALEQAVPLEVGDRVYAFSNLFGIATGDEPASVQHGVVAMTASLHGRQGSIAVPYRGPVYLIDAMTNNAGATGGALTDATGRLAGILGKEVRHEESGIWVNYAIPIEPLREIVAGIVAGKGSGPSQTTNAESPPDHPWSLVQAGIRFVPDVLAVTPPYVDSVVPGSKAEAAGLRPDDLVMFVRDQLVRSQGELNALVRAISDSESLALVVLRDQELVPVTLAAVE